MVHKILPSPTSGVETNFLYGEDWNKLIDHLEGRSKTDPFTFTVNEDTIKHSTTNTAGDILKGDGTRYSRWAKGTANQIIQVNDAGTDLEWIDPPTAPAGLWDPDEVETLTGKTLNVDANTFKHSTTNAAGDLLVNDGTKFARLARGTALQIPRVKSDLTGLEFVTPTIATGGYNQIVFKSGSTYYAADRNGIILNSSTTDPGAVINTCLALGGKTYVAAGTYTMGASFTGLNVGIDGTHLDMDPGCTLTVPDGYTGYVIRVHRALGTGPNLHQARVWGGHLTEASGVSGSHLWTGLLIQGGPNTNQGVSMSTFRDIFIEYAGTGVNQDTTTTLGFITGCIFENITCSGCPIGFDFNSPTPAVAANSIARNTYINCIAQDYDSVPTMFGFKNIRYKDHVFVHCKAWDLNTGIGAQTATIHQDAKNITVIGGIMAQTSATQGFFKDESKSTLILQDEWNPPRYGGLSLVNNVFGIKGKRTGMFEGTATTNGTGLMGGNLTAYAATGTATIAVTYADGTVGRVFPTIATTANGTGLRSISDTTCRGWNPIFRIMFKLSSTTNIRPYFGWATGSNDLAGDDPLNALSGVILTARAADTNFFIGTNNGSGATTFTNTGIAKDTNIKVFDLVAQDGYTNKWKWALYNESVLRSISQSMIPYTELTTSDIPAQDTPLRPFFQLTTAENAIKSFTCYQVYLETD